MGDFVSVRFDASGWTSAIDRLGRDFGKAIERGVNRTLQNASTAMVKVIADDMGLAQKIVRPFIQSDKANANGQRWVGRLYASSAKVPLLDFGAKGPEPSRGRGAGVTAKLPPPGAGRYPHLFIAAMSSGHRGVFGRVPGRYMQKIGRHGGRRQAIEEKFGPSVYHVFQKHQDVAEARAMEMLVTNITHEVQFLLSQVAA